MGFAWRAKIAQKQYLAIAIQGILGQEMEARAGE
tara:strand:+ start:43 stop:144 length:102 start_codon:yes stop_codon:yes gene_type:complete